MNRYLSMLLGLLMAFLLAFLFSGCQSGDSNQEETDTFLAVMETGGYVFEQRDEDSREYYQANQVNQKYDLDVDVIDLYVGYVNQNDRWAEVVVLATNAQAASFKSELDIEATEGRLVLLQDNIILITYSQETIALFNTSK